MTIPDLTPDQLAAIRAIVFGTNVAIDDAGNGNFGGNVTAANGIWTGNHIVPTPMAVAALPPFTVGTPPAVNPDAAGFFLVSDALDPVKGNPVLGGGGTPTLVWNDGAAYRVL